MSRLENIITARKPPGTPQLQTVLRWPSSRSSTPVRSARRRSRAHHGRRRLTPSDGRRRRGLEDDLRGVAPCLSGQCPGYRLYDVHGRRQHTSVRHPRQRRQLELDGCPDDGPSLAVDSGGRVHIAWPTLVTGADGEPNGDLLRHVVGRAELHASAAAPDQGTPHHPQIAWSRGRVLVTWDELKGGTRQIVLASRSDEAPADESFSRQVVSGPTRGYPAVSATDSRVLVAWTEVLPGASRVRVASLPVAASAASPH